MSRPLLTAAAVSILVFISFAAAGALLTKRVEQNVDQNARKAMTMRSDAIADATSAEIARYLDTVRLVAATLGAVETINADAFQAATAPLATMDLAGATSVAFIAPPVRTAGIAELETLWRSRGIADLDLIPVGDSRNEHVFSIFSTPLDDSTATRTGIDVSVATAPHEALMESWRSGGPALSDAYQLIIDQQLPPAQRQTSFSLTLPVSRGGRHLGWVLMGIRGQDFLGHVLNDAGEGKVTATLLADDIAGQETTVAAVATAKPSDSAATASPSPTTAAPRLRAGYERTLDLRAVQHRWTLHVGAEESALVGGTRYRPELMTAAGLLGAVMAAALAWTTMSRRARTRAHIEAATSGLIEAEAATRREAHLFTSTLDTIDDVGVSVIDETGEFLLHSKAARAILGIEVNPQPTGAADPGTSLATSGIGESDGINSWQRHYGMFNTDGTDFSADDMPLVRALAGEATDGVEMVIRNPAKPDGVHIVVSGRPIDLGEGRKGALAVFRDVTVERQQHAELTGFAGMVAHDLKRPLTVTIAYLDLLTEDVLPALHGDHDTVATAREHLRRVRSASYRMSELIDSLLAYTTARDAPLHTRLLDLDDLVRDTLHDLIAQNPTDENARPHVHVSELPSIEGDPDRLRQVIANLVSNAVKYVAPGATPNIDIAAETYKAAGTLRTRILIADRGIGIAQRDRTRVLKAFERAHTATLDGATYTGTGLGLAISNRIVRRHGGTLALQHNPGGGTIAVVDLPFVQAGETSNGQTPQPQPRTDDLNSDDTARNRT